MATSTARRGVCGIQTELSASVPAIAFTPGEPAGIGPDLAIALARTAAHDIALVIIADSALLEARARLRGETFIARAWMPTATPTPGTFAAQVPLRAPAVAGTLDPRNAEYVLATLNRAVDGCLAGEFAGLVTGPVHKGVINDAGKPFSGHTEFLAARAGNVPVVMMLTSPRLRVALATTHIPLHAVAAAITPARLRTTLRVLGAELAEKYALPRARIAVCGLNPHAGEGGHLGREEIDVIAPVLAELRAEGARIDGPLPADTVFGRARDGAYDAVLAMYHDQGLPVLKYDGFGSAVNVTLGLPFIRTSVDHGTALDCAGTPRVNTGSAQAALAAALTMVRARATRR